MRFHYYTYFCLLLLFLLSTPIKFIKWKLVRKPENRTRDISQYATEKPEQCSPVTKSWVCLILTSWDSLLMWVLQLNLSTVRGTTLLSHRDEEIWAAGQRSVSWVAESPANPPSSGSGSREQRQSADHSRPTGHGGTNTWQLCDNQHVWTRDVLETKQADSSEAEGHSRRPHCLWLRSVTVLWRHTSKSVGSRTTLSRTDFGV